jgi:hypothetical protein
MFLFILLVWGRHLRQEGNFRGREEDDEKGEEWSALRSTALLIFIVIIIIIITAGQPVPKTALVSLTSHFLFSFPPTTV